MAQWPSRVHPADLVPLLFHYVELAGIAVVSVGAVVLAVACARRTEFGPRVSVPAAGVKRFRVLLPEAFDRDGPVGFFLTVSELLRPVLLGADPSVGFTLSSLGQQLEIELSCTAEVAPAAVAALEAAIDGIGLDEIGESEMSRERRRRARCTLRPAGSRWLPLESKHKVDPSRQVLAMLKGDGEQERACVQLVFSPLTRRATRRARAEARLLRTGRRGGALTALGTFGLELANDGLDLLTPGSSSSHTRTAAQTYAPDRSTVTHANAIEEKASEPLLAATVRLAVSGGKRGWMRWRLRALASSFAQFRALGGLRAGREFGSAHRFERRLPARRPPLALTAAEAAALLPLPSRTADTPLVIAEAPARSLPPAADAPREGVLVGKGERSGFAGELRVGVEALTQHVHVLGPTGRGKTTLLCGMYLEAARLGLGAMYAEPKGDAIDAIRRRIPDARIGDVVLLDFGDEEYPPALNLLACAPGEEDIHAEALVGIFRHLFGRYWGPRSEDILRSAFGTLLANRQPGRPVPTLADVLNLLTDPAVKARHPVVSDPVALGQFWRQWQALSTGQREQALAPVANKLRAFLGRRALRNILCQEDAPDFERIIRERKLVLVSLPTRTLGDAADLVGSVLIYRLWQAAQRLAPDPSRPPFLCLVDEAHRFCRLPGGLAQALAEARGYRLGFLLAHQNLAQLGDADLAEAVHANTQTKLCFSLPPLDAHRMAGHFAPRLDEDGLARLGPYRIACRISHNGRQLPAATATAQPLPLATRQGGLVGARVRAPSRAELEATILARYGRNIEPPPGGRGDPDSGPPPGPNDDPSSGPDLGGAPSGPPFGPPFHGGPGKGASAHGDDESGEGEFSDQDRSNAPSLPIIRRGGDDAAAA